MAGLPTISPLTPVDYSTNFFLPRFGGGVSPGWQENHLIMYLSYSSTNIRYPFGPWLDKWSACHTKQNLFSKSKAQIGKWIVGRSIYAAGVLGAKALLKVDVVQLMAIEAGFKVRNWLILFWKIIELQSCEALQVQFTIAIDGWGESQQPCSAQAGGCWCRLRRQCLWQSASLLLR